MASSPSVGDPCLHSYQILVTVHVCKIDSKFQLVHYIGYWSDSKSELAIVHLVANLQLQI